MAKADYTHSIEKYKGRNVIVIEDLNIGNMSVTNNIEEVVAEIATMESIDPNDHIIIYKDSESIWDGWNNSSQTFIPINSSAADWYEVMEQFETQYL